MSQRFDPAALGGQTATMKLGRCWGLVLALATIACSGDSAPDVDSADALCRQWDRADAQTAAQAEVSDDPYAETTKLAEMLPDEYQHDAALFFYPYAGDPGPDADGAMAADAGGRLDAFRMDVCGEGLPEGER